MGYKFEATVRLEFPELGEDTKGEPFYVIMRNPRFLTYKEDMESAKLGMFTMNGEVKEGMSTQETFNLIDADKMAAWAMYYVISWNLIDKYTGNQISPTAENASDVIPHEVISAIIAEIRRVPDNSETKN